MRPNANKSHHYQLKWTMELARQQLQAAQEMVDLGNKLIRVCTKTIQQTELKMALIITNDWHQQLYEVVTAYLNDRLPVEFASAFFQFNIKRMSLASTEDIAQRHVAEASQIIQQLPSIGEKFRFKTRIGRMKDFLNANTISKQVRASPLEEYSQWCQRSRLDRYQSAVITPCELSETIFRGAVSRGCGN